MSGATDLAIEILVHGAIAAIVVHLLIRRVPIAAPATRLAYRFAVLLLPLVIAPLLRWLAPFRGGVEFADVAVFATSRWQDLAVAGVPLPVAAFVVAAASGLALLAPDVAHLVANRRRERRARVRHLHRDDDRAGLILRHVEACCAAMRVPVPDVRLIDLDAPLLHCRGVRRPSLIVSSGAVSRLRERELRAAVAHELVHVQRHDVLRGWILLALRTVQWFNPVAQVVARRAVQEMEFEADRRAALLTGQPLAVARGLLRAARTRPAHGWLAGARGRISAVEERCHRLLALHDHPEAHPARAARELAAAAAALAALLFFVV